MREGREREMPNDYIYFFYQVFFILHVFILFCECLISPRVIWCDGNTSRGTRVARRREGVLEWSGIPKRHYYGTREKKGLNPAQEERFKNVDRVRRFRRSILRHGAEGRFKSCNLYIYSTSLLLFLFIFIFPLKQLTFNFICRCHQQQQTTTKKHGNKNS